MGCRGITVGVMTDIERTRLLAVTGFAEPLHFMNSSNYLLSVDALTKNVHNASESL